jgi:hypothetical protein
MACSSCIRHHYFFVCRISIERTRHGVASKHHGTTAVRQPPVGAAYSRAYVSATSALYILRIFAIMPFTSCMATYIRHLGHFVSLHVDLLWEYSPQTRFLSQSVTSIRLSAMGRYRTRLHTRVDILALPQIH